MIKLHLKVINAVGLHARPAAIFVREAAKFKSTIRVCNATTDRKWADAKSILGVLTLGVEKDHEIDLEIDGPDEELAASRLKGLIESDFSGA
jgi:phosphocarrier protein HPr